MNSSSPARALAEDFGRSLAAEPILARPPSLSYWVANKIRQHPVTTGLLVATALAVVMTTGLSLRARLAAREGARPAQRFGQEAERIDGRMRLAEKGSHFAVPSCEGLAQGESLRNDVAVSKRRGSG